jgi:bifunctional non-homologous end joining protein LigD
VCGTIALNETRTGGKLPPSIDEDRVRLCLGEIMSLKEYAEKRNFSQTPEPGPSAVRPSHDAPHFYVQRHDASRLHYDFRLEIDGTLKSWAIPKGPTLDPAPKRLAAMVEDHPLEYGDFEGNIPKGQYGGGSVMLWDRGTFELLGDLPALKQIEKGDLKFRLHGEKLQGEFAIVHMKNRGKGNEWLLLKKRDAFAKPGWDVEEHAVSVKTGRTQEEIAKDLPGKKPAAPEAPGRSKKKTNFPPLPTNIAPMMATLAEKPPRGNNWLFEIKWDGVRGLCFIENGELRIVSRNGNRCERQYPELSVLPHYIHAKQAILDGEIAVLDERGVSSFPLIQPRITNQDPNVVSHMARKTPVHLFLFDLLWLDGEDWRGRPLRERKEKLQEIVKEHTLIKVSNAFQGSGDDILEAARQYGLEGVVAKRADSFYEPKRSQDWLKIKLVTEDDFVICGFLKKKREYFGSLILGAYEDGKPRHVGQVGTGFDNRTIEQLYRKLEPLVTDQCPFGAEPKIVGGGEVVWVRPELVAKIKFLCWTKDHILRAPVFLGLRDDVNPRETAAVPEEEQLEVQEPLGLSGAEAVVDVEGRRLKFTNLNKVLFPKDGYTKRDLVSYYDSVANLILPHLKDRPLSLKRYPNGIHEPYFFQKDAPTSFPDWLRFETFEDIRYVLAEDRAALLYLANLACIDHNPFQSRVGSIENPDWILIDLDPQECSFDRIVEAALLVRKKLDILELEGYPKTTGGHGMHIYVPVEPHYSYEETKSFAEVIARTLAGEYPDLFTTPRSVSKRQKNRVYFDYLQNGMGKTIAAPYVVRAHDGAPVATPLSWDEVKLGLYPSQFTIKNAAQRFEAVGDLFAGVLKKPQSLHGAVGRLEKLMVKAAK